MKKGIVRIVLLVPLVCLLSVYVTGEQRVVPGETIVLAENIIIEGPFIAPKLVSKEEFQERFGFDWTNEVPYQIDIPYKTYHELDAFPWSLEWPSRHENGEQFIPLAKPEDKKPKFIPIEPLEAAYKFLQNIQK